MVIRLLIVVAAGIVLYVFAFVYVVKKPLTHGFVAAAYALKAEYATRATGPRIFLVAGSNGLYSFRCEVIEAIVDRPCVNLSLTADLGPVYLLGLAERFARPGDTVVVALEYVSYQVTEESIDRQRTHPYRVTYDREGLTGLAPPTLARALFQFGLRYFLGACIEMMMDALGVDRRVHVGLLTRNGDMSGHDTIAARAYRQYLKGLAFEVSRSGPFRISPVARAIVGDFIERARDRGLLVVGTLPVVFAGAGVDETVASSIAALYEEFGAAFAVLPNRHVLDRTCFFDTHYHLREECQIAHSRAFGAALRAVIERSKAHE